MSWSFYIGGVVIRVGLALPALFYRGDGVGGEGGGGGGGGGGDGGEPLKLLLIAGYLGLYLVSFLVFLFIVVGASILPPLSSPPLSSPPLSSRRWWIPILSLVMAGVGLSLSFAALFITPVAWMGVPLLLDAVWSSEVVKRERPFELKGDFDLEGV